MYLRFNNETRKFQRMQIQTNENVSVRKWKFERTETTQKSIGSVSNLA